MDTVIEQRRANGAAPERTAPAAGFRTDIQALRAIAVLAVVINHLSAGWLPGGYVGVDVFFVISGFLISSHLDREIVRTGRVRLARFYARRIRRLLPAALLVLALSVVAAYFLLPYPRWEATAQEAFASALYWENWLLAGNSVDYSAANAAASLVQHYWSLSVEEQFYLFWPLLLLLLFRVRARRAQFVGIAVIGAASFAFSVYFTKASPNEAYFVTPARVWEFALGALVALAASRLVLPRVAAGAMSFVGFTMIIVSAVGYDHHTPFPGYLAIVPAAGTAMVIASGLRPGRQWHSVVTASWPVQFVGNVSYSLYLWHWPLILLAPFVLSDVLDAGRMTTPFLVGLLVVSLVLAWLSKVLVEDRGISFQPLSRSTLRTFAATIVAMALVVVSAGVLNWTYDKQVAQAEREAAAIDAAIDTEDVCIGGSAMDPANDCADRLGPAQVVTMGPTNNYAYIPDGCVQLDEHKAGDTKTTSICDYSRGEPNPQEVWLVGDSHAQHWMTPVLDMAKERKWVLKFAILGGCPFADVSYVGYRSEAPEETTRTCTEWTRHMAPVIADDEPDLVFFSFFSRMEQVDDGSDRSQTEQYRDGVEPYWRSWTDAGAQVVVFGDPPLNRDVRAVDCVELNPDDPLACAVDRKVAQPPDPLAEVSRTTDVPGVTPFDPTKYLCDEDKCYAVVGGLAVYYDGDHMNAQFSRSLIPMITAAAGLR